jgi:alpha-D-ribose 1-methylphosphonate 5-triphosphate diphosphatase
MTRHLENARIVTADGLHHGSVTIEDGRIVALNGDAPKGAACLDLRGDLLLPGLIDLHGDAIEKEVEPRPNAFFPLPVALDAIDRRMVAAGVTASALPRANWACVMWNLRKSWRGVCMVSRARSITLCISATS